MKKENFHIWTKGIAGIAVVGFGVPALCTWNPGFMALALVSAYLCARANRKLEEINN